MCVLNEWDGRRWKKNVFWCNKGDALAVSVTALYLITYFVWVFIYAAFRFKLIFYGPIIFKMIYCRSFTDDIVSTLHKLKDFFYLSEHANCLNREKEKNKFRSVRLLTFCYRHNCFLRWKYWHFFLLLCTHWTYCVDILLLSSCLTCPLSSPSSWDVCIIFFFGCINKCLAD